MSETPTPRSRGLLSYMGMLVGGLTLAAALLSVVNVAAGLDLSIGVGGADTPLPESWDAVAGLAAGGLLILGLSAFGGWIAERFRSARGKPLQRVAIVLITVVLLGVVGRGLQVVALTATYGSMLAYYATDGDAEDLADELAKGPSRAALDSAVGRAAQYNNSQALAMLLEGGADLLSLGAPDADGYCVLSSTDLHFVQTALEHGVGGPEDCVNSEGLIWETVKFYEGSDAELAAQVRMLKGAGWSPIFIPEDRESSPLQLAQSQGWTQTVAVLEGR